jgi:sugar/nucleoside kinase (ribokinase family)
VVVKDGAQGATIPPRRCREVPTTAIVAPDTTGAGDAFAAGFLVRWLADEANANRDGKTRRRRRRAAIVPPVAPRHASPGSMELSRPDLSHAARSSHRSNHSSIRRCRPCAGLDDR